MSKQQRMASRERRQIQAAVAARRRRRTNLLRGVGGLVIAGLLIAIGVAVFNAATKDDSTTAAAGGTLVTPANLTPGGAIPVGPGTAPVTVEIYLDYMCPACGKFEETNSGELDRLIAAGTVKV